MSVQLIRIHQRAEGPDGFQAIVSLNSGPEHPFTIKDPFTPKEEEELEWYFEDHVQFPFTKQVRAEKAAASILPYGESLFKQAFSDPDVYTEYRSIRDSGLSELQIEIAGSPKFHALHWEALKDPKLEQSLALQAIMVRKNLNPQAVPISPRSSPTINLLIVTARPSGRRDIGYRTISRPLVESLRRANLPIQVDIVRPGTYKALENHLRKHGEGYYHVVHFDLHGAVLTYEQLPKYQQDPGSSPYQYQRYARQEMKRYEGAIAFLSFEPDEGEKVTADLVEAAELAKLLATHRVPIAMLNACQSGKQMGERETSLGSRLIQEGVQLVLAMGYSVTVSAAELLMTTLYRQLFAGDDLRVAIRHARTELYNEKQRRAYFDQRIDLEDWLLPVVYQNYPLQLQPREFTPQEHQGWLAREVEAKRYTPPNPTYGFVGRDLDILQIERRLLFQGNILLVRGMGGAGKTTLLKHLGGWWHTTGFVRHVFYFGYDTRAWTRQQIITAIAQDLYGSRYYTDFQPLLPEQQQVMLAQKLRSERHLLILDNLESITGAQLAIEHTLPVEERAALQSFLSDLRKGNTLVLLGSRGSEDWLASGTFENNIYDLPGLDPEAASTLADRSLKRNHATRYREDETENLNLRKLIKVLDGFPLAMEVVLANLAHQTPKEVLEDLQAGDVRLDIDESKQHGKSIFEQKTEGILRCIDYSHSNLSREAQQLLLCLTPFTSVIYLPGLKNYTAHLKEQPVLAHLLFERWPEVIREAQNWGLLSPHVVPGFLHLQPIFPYFLRTRLNESGQAKYHSAIEAAFREYYVQLGKELSEMLQSNDPEERQVGQLLTRLEYDNLVAALNLALAEQTSISGLHNALLHYLNAMPDRRRGVELYTRVLD